jgi:CheY-like chemotaxis protein
MLLDLAMPRMNGLERWMALRGAGLADDFHLDRRSCAKWGVWVSASRTPR